MSGKNLRIISVIIVVLLSVFLIKTAVLSKSIFMSKETKHCIKCHNTKDIHTSQIVEWKKSVHAKKGVGCFECHQAKKGDSDAWDHEGYNIATIVSPFDCARCHKKEFEEFDRSHHAKAGEILGSADNYLGEVVEGAGASVQGCQNCHGTIIKMHPDPKLAAKGKFDPATWPNLGIGRLNPDGSKGSCSACHSKHRFSLKVARAPEACGKCHMGPDHPQLEIYEESKHGINYGESKDDIDLYKSHLMLGKDYSQAPNCVTCHMGANKNNMSSHDLGERLSWSLRGVVSKHQDDWEEKRAEMQKVCSNCHGPEWYKNFYTQFDNTVSVYDNRYGKPANEIMNLLKKEAKVSKVPFDEEMEWIFFELWHHEGRRARHGAAMMGPDYVQWHGFYEVSQHFYQKFIPKARKLGGPATNAYIDKLLAQPEHLWVKGIKPDNLIMQEKAFKEWGKIRKDALAKKAVK